MLVHAVWTVNTAVKAQQRRKARDMSYDDFETIPKTKRQNPKLRIGADNQLNRCGKTLTNKQSTVPMPPPRSWKIKERDINRPHPWCDSEQNQKKYPKYQSRGLGTVRYGLIMSKINGFPTLSGIVPHG